MAKEYVNGAIIDMGLALYLVDVKRSRVIAKKWVKRVSASNKKLLYAMLQMTDEHYVEALEEAIALYLSTDGVNKKGP